MQLLSLIKHKTNDTDIILELMKAIQNLLYIIIV